ncbi:unnamed protein product [Lepeophtheirus salmonis]|uniref:(salmon louse) hypothetical protein n=1 Tax=Lepeophtheirus salmonis TaxID=72036 RepID=A0A817FAP9_LEPSM|nr:unnamed protein product [Lepeophtheirus salmonis]CAG9476067.1 unnamed protein product [Lepeophtheirus salmonis]
MHINAMHPSEWEEYKIRHYASNLPPQWDEDLYKAIASMERHLINERSSEAEQNLHAWLSQLFAISCDDVVKIRHRQAYINISNEIQIAPIEAETRELHTAVEFAQTYPDRSDDSMSDHVCMRFSYRPRKSVLKRLQNPDLVLKAVISTWRRLDNTTTEVSSDSNASSRLVNITTDTSVSATNSLVAPQEPTEAIDLETSPVPKETMRIEGTTPPTRPAEMSTPNCNARHRRELKRPIEAEETPVSKRTQRPAADTTPTLQTPPPDTATGELEQANLASSNRAARAQAMLLLRAAVRTPMTHPQIMSELESQGVCQHVVINNAHTNNNNINTTSHRLLSLPLPLQLVRTMQRIRMIQRHLGTLSYRERLLTDAPDVRSWVQTNPLYLPFALCTLLKLSEGQVTVWLKNKTQ